MEKICKKVPFLVIRIDLRPIINNVLGNWKAVTKYVLVPSFQNEKNMQRLTDNYWTCNCPNRCSISLLKANRVRTIVWGHNFEGGETQLLHCYQPTCFTLTEFIEILLNAIK